MKGGPFVMKTGGSPFFSVVVPTYERPAQLALCLAALARLAKTARGRGFMPLITRKHETAKAYVHDWLEPDQPAEQRRQQ